VGDEKEGRKEKETKGETDFFVYSLVLVEGRFVPIVVPKSSVFVFVRER